MTQGRHGPSAGTAPARATLRLARVVDLARSWVVANTMMVLPVHERWRRPLVAYSATVLTQLIAIVLVVEAQRVVPIFQFPEAILVLSIVLVALAFGAAPALLATVVSCALLGLLLTPIGAALALPRVEDGVGLAVLFIVGATLGLGTGAAVRARWQAEEATRRMDELLSIISHELRNPLTAAKASIQLAERALQREAEPHPELEALIARQADLLSRADVQVDRINLLVDDLLDASRARTGKLTITLAPCDLAAIVREAVEEQRQAQPERTVKLALPAGPVPVIADARRVAQVVTNFLTNALKYSDAASLVEVQLDVIAGRAARVSVRDHGPGLPPAQQARIWERGYRAPGVAVRSGTGVGLGLGLYISKTIIERQHGKVGIRSTPGQGATFWFRLPLA